ncbi:MAG: 50S ribosomal protein L4 [Campylobacterales bacterium]|nr:50S ribosomal protein L4 [Campylobacterales bacterium]
MSAIVLNNQFEKASELALPESFEGINAHNLYLYVKSYQAGLRSDTASAKTRAFVSGGGKKPWAQKGRGGARAGSRRSPVWVGGAVVHGPNTGRNYDQKINKKQKKLALKFALDEHAKNGSLFIVDSITVESGKTKDAQMIFDKIGARDAVFVKSVLDEKTYLAFRNIAKSYVIEENELNAYVAAAYRAIVIEKAVWENLTGKA